MEAETTTRGRTELSWGKRLLVVFFGLMLVAFGVVFIMVVGRNAIQQRSYDMPWSESRGFLVGIFGMHSQSSSGVAQFRGADAVRVGAGFALFGALLALWGALIVRAVFQRPNPAAEIFARPRGAGLVLGVASFAMLVAAQMCFFPVWQTDGIVFWCVVVGSPVIVGLLKRAGKAKWTGIPFIALIVLAMLVPAPGISTAVVLGIFATVFCFVHVVFLFPDFFSEKLSPPGHN